MLRELVRMDVAQRINLAEGDAGAVAAVHRDVFLDLRRRLEVARLERLEVHVRAVAVVVDRQDLLLETALLEVLRAADDCVHRAARLLRRDILVHHLLAAAGVDEMVEADAVDVLRLDEVEDAVELLDVVVVDRKAQADALADGHAVLDALHGLLIGAVDTAELVVDILESVERDADVADADILDALGDLARDQRAVRRERRAHAFLLRVSRELEEIRADQRLAAREQQHRHVEVREIIDELLGLFRRQLILVFLGIRLHIAVHALEVAGLRRVPDDDRADALRRAIAHRVCILRVAQAVTEVVPCE